MLFTMTILAPRPRERVLAVYPRARCIQSVRAGITTYTVGSVYDPKLGWTSETEWLAKDCLSAARAWREAAGRLPKTDNSLL